MLQHKKINNEEGKAREWVDIEWAAAQKYAIEETPEQHKIACKKFQQARNNIVKTARKLFELADEHCIGDLSRVQLDMHGPDQHMLIETDAGGLCKWETSKENMTRADFDESARRGW